MPLPASSLSKLGDHFGQYLLCISCATYRHFWELDPKVLAKQFGWEASFAEVIATISCPRCKSKPCDVEVGFDQRPRKWGRDR